VEVVETVKDLHHHRTGLRFGETFHFLEIGVKVAVGAVFQPEDDVALCLESVKEVDEVVVLDGEEDIFLVFKHLGFLDRCDGVLADELESAVLIVELAFPQEHLRKASAAEELEDLEVPELQTVIADRLF
jgi:hypothetical protein